MTNTETNNKPDTLLPQIIGTEYQCQVCPNTFIAKRAKHYTCSNTCRRRLNRRRQDSNPRHYMIAKICKQCGEALKLKKGKTGGYLQGSAFCNPVCRARFYYEQSKDI